MTKMIRVACPSCDGSGRVGLELWDPAERRVSGFFLPKKLCPECEGTGRVEVEDPEEERRAALAEKRERERKEAKEEARLRREAEKRERIARTSPAPQPNSTPGPARRGDSDDDEWWRQPSIRGMWWGALVGFALALLFPAPFVNDATSRVISAAIVGGGFGGAIGAFYAQILAAILIFGVLAALVGLWKLFT